VESLRDVFARVTTITFDCYGTLIDWDKGLRQSLSDLFDNHPAVQTEEFLHVYMETEAQVEAEKFRDYRDVLTEVAIRLAKRFSIALPEGRAATLADLLPTWTPFSDTNDALTRLKKKYKLGVLSNVDRDLFAETATQFPVEFDFIVTAQDVGSYKPSPGHFAKLFTQHAPREETLHVAQSLFHDGAPARDLDLAFVWINRYNDSTIEAIPMVAEFGDLKSFAEKTCG